MGYGMRKLEKKADRLTLIYAFPLLRSFCLAATVHLDFS